MTAYLFLPFAFIRFWFVEAPIGMIHYFGSVNRAFLQLFSLALFIKTFFKPLKNEYREGLVGFSIAMGVFVKSILIFVDLILFILLLFCELLCILYFLALPFISIYILFI
jgi:hypothetical protein